MKESCVCKFSAISNKWIVFDLSRPHVFLKRSLDKLLILCLIFQLKLTLYYLLRKYWVLNFCYLIFLFKTHNATVLTDVNYLSLRPLALQMAEK